jgi:small conductance mechanosensitive channel
VHFDFTFDGVADLLLSILDGVLSFVLIFALLGLGLRLTTWLIRRGVERRKYLMSGWDHSEGEEERTESITRVLQTAARAIFGLLALILIISSFGVNLGAILASVSLFSIALGFGAQYLVRDYLSGMLILSEDQFRVGDSVEINKISGTVEDMRLRLTVLRDGDGTVHHIPNGEIRVASNRSKEFNKVNQFVSVGYGSDLRDVFAIIDGVGNELANDPDWKPFILETLHAVRVQDLAEKFVSIRVGGETVPGKGGAVEGEFRLRLLDEFAKLGVDTAYPKIDAPDPKIAAIPDDDSTRDLTDRSTTDDEHNKDDANA